MGEKNRIFGNNIQVFLKDKGIQPEYLAEQLGYSVQEVRRIMDARLFLTMKERQDIADALGVTIEELYQVRDDKTYEMVGCLECRGEFSRPEHKKEILDLFDIYCDIQELLVEEDLKELSIKSSI
ncbi:MAG: helix-turn-helix transcriptional regulator [Muribaculaceae bacterium]|nr:helix-turn-helix transcriptional regulator [Muribaculaceae bacterium]MCM1494082.1 helix-turn-helix transcriptional regulator [Muribaculaceae bacterium]MCM1561345.1 helix-turn-helix transcriptional regulator [Butyrivibrio sp.]